MADDTNQIGLEDEESTDVIVPDPYVSKTSTLREVIFGNLFSINGQTDEKAVIDYISSKNDSGGEASVMDSKIGDVITIHGRNLGAYTSIQLKIAGQDLPISVSNIERHISEAKDSNDTIVFVVPQSNGLTKDKNIFVIIRGDSALPRIIPKPFVIHDTEKEEKEKEEQRRADEENRINGGSQGQNTQRFPDPTNMAVQATGEIIGGIAQSLTGYGTQRKKGTVVKASAQQDLREIVEDSNEEMSAEFETPTEVSANPTEAEVSATISGMERQEASQKSEINSTLEGIERSSGGGSATINANVSAGTTSGQFPSGTGQSNVESIATTPNTTAATPNAQTSSVATGVSATGAQNGESGAAQKSINNQNNTSADITAEQQSSAPNGQNVSQNASSSAGRTPTSSSPASSGIRKSNTEPSNPVTTSNQGDVQQAGPSLDKKSSGAEIEATASVESQSAPVTQSNQPETNDVSGNVKVSPKQAPTNNPNPQTPSNQPNSEKPSNPSKEKEASPEPAPKPLPSDPVIRPNDDVRKKEFDSLVLNLKKGDLKPANLAQTVKREALKGLNRSLKEMAAPPKRSGVNKTSDNNEAEEEIVEGEEAGEIENQEIEGTVDGKFSKTVRRVQTGIRIAEKVAKLTGQEGIARALGEVGDVADTGKNDPGLTRNAASNLAGNKASKLAQDRLGISGDKGAAIGGAVAGALDGKGIGGIAKSAAGWYILYFAFGALFTLAGSIPALLYLNIHYIFSKIGISWFVTMTVKQKLTLLIANLILILGIILLFVIIIYTGCNYPLGKIAGSYKGSLLGAMGYSSVCETMDGALSAVSPSTSSLPATTGPVLLTDNASVGNGVCKVAATGPASVANLAASCFGSNAAQASAIAVAESGGNPLRASGVDVCADGSVASWGLFQINLTNHKFGNLDCTKAFDSQFTAKNHNCHVIDQNLYNQCVEAAKDASQNISVACIISKNGASWNQWGSHNKCGL